MEGLNSASHGAMASLLWKLVELARVEDRASDLRDDLRNIYTKLAKLSEVDDPSLTINYWVKDVRELSYDMEDCIDQFVHTDDADAKTAWMDNLLEFKTRVEDVRERYDRYRLEYGLSHPTATGSHRFRTVYRGASTVGMASPTIELRRLLKPERDDEIDLQLKVVSILGAEGVGKSTLAQELWRELGGQFECQAFVQTAKKPDMRMILRNILSQIHQRQPPEAYKVPNLIHDIRKHLQDKRFFIIIDGIWTVQVWDILSHCFPEGKHRSRIVTTTTIEDVALACCGYDPELIFRMKPLDAEDSKQLFISRVFGTGEVCPQQFNDVSNDITKKCGGLPLAIICIASLVASHPERVEQWAFVQNFLRHDFGTNSSFAEVLKQVLKLCYNSLPDCLKTCLLYLSIYPENYLFLKDDLVRQWIAEDFVCTTEGKDIVQVASSYFDQLRSLGLIEHMNTMSNKKGLSYVVHPTVFDFIICKSMEDNFITTIDYSQSTAVLTEKVRRLSLHFGSATYATIPASVELSQVRSLAFMGLLGCIPSIAQFKFVRVMILHISSDNGEARFSLSEISKLLMLRYLQVRCNVSVELPDQMQCLKHLETLEINAEVAAIPSDIAHVPRLSNVCIGGKKIREHLTLSPVASGKAIGMDDSRSASTPSIQIFELLPPICIFSRIPEWIGQLHKLHVFEIVVRELQSNDINVLAELPVLTALSLYVRRPTAEHIVCSRGAFPALEYFKLVCGVVFLNFEEDTMPNLRRLKIGFNARRGGDYGHMLGGIQHLLNLEEIAASTGKCTGAEESHRIAAESALSDAISSHPSQLRFKIKRVDPVEEEYDHSKIQYYCSQETEQHVIRVDELSIKESIALLYAMGAMWQKIKCFTVDEIEEITNNYGTLIGKGGFGEVYKGVLDDHYDLVAVKRYIRAHLRKEFMEEVSIHSQISHKNVVKFIGYCLGESTLTLVTEYVPKGNLDDILHNSDTAIPLDIRLGIAIGCAEALSYMHSMHLSIDSLVCHGGIKPANILLNDNFTAKLSDFGLSRLLLGGISQYSDRVMGSINYMDPVYMHTGLLTPRNDVYSFGIVLLELVTRKRVRQGDMNLIQNFKCAKGKGLRKLFDASIANKNSIKILEETVELAMECLRLDIQNRPQMNHVAKRLRMLKRDLKCRQKHASSQSILSIHHAWHEKGKHEITQLQKSGSFFKRNASNSKIISEFSNVRSFTKEELKEITDNYSYILSGGMLAKFYKGTLEDNTVVAVRKFLGTDSQEAFVNGGIVLSQIVHENIIKLLGCCLEAETLAFIYEYADKGSLLDILGSQEHLPLDLRMRIAIKTAEALQYLHSSATGIIGHGSVAASTILLDNRFMPKLTDFSGACKLITNSGRSNASDSVINSFLLEKILCNDPSRYRTVLMNLESDVYRFGGVLLALVSREINIGFDDLIVTFAKAYQKDNSGKAMFDKDITVEQDIAVLEEIGRLALKCTILNADEMVMRPTMQEVAEQLRWIRRCWKLRTTEAAPHVTETTATAAHVSTLSSIQCFACL